MRVHSLFLFFSLGCAPVVSFESIYQERFSPASSEEEAAEALAPSPPPETQPVKPTSIPAKPWKLLAGNPQLEQSDLDYLTQRELLLPVEGIAPQKLIDTFDAPRSGGRTHRAIDIIAPRGSLIRATTDGIIYRLENDKRGGISIYELDPSGMFVYYYAHLDRYAKDLQLGQWVNKGDLIGYVGDTGNAKGTPHLHFSVFKVTDPKIWWKGLSINPYYLLTRKPYPGYNTSTETK